jgi:hypothetical protein
MTWRRAVGMPWVRISVLGSMLGRNAASNVRLGCPDQSPFLRTKVLLGKEWRVGVGAVFHEFPTGTGPTSRTRRRIRLAYTFDDAKAPTKKTSQYYEMLGSRAIWANGWTAATWHEKGKAWDDDKWELYNTDEDFSQAHDLAEQNPEKLKELQALWLEEAKKNSVLPLDGRRYERVADPSRPVAALPRSHYVFYPGTSMLHPLAAPQILGVDHKITANVELANSSGEGVLACSGGEFGGWSLYLKDGKLVYTHNYLKTHEYTVASAKPVPPWQASAERAVPPDRGVETAGLLYRGHYLFSRRGNGRITQGHQGRRPI